MDFFGIGFGELLLILILALIVWGPRRLPEIARTLGKMARTLKRASSDLTAEMTREIEEDKSHLPPKELSGDKAEKTSPEGKSKRQDNKGTTKPGS